MRLGAASLTRRTTLAESPPRCGSTTSPPGRAPPSASPRRASPTSPAKEPAVAVALRRAVAGAPAGGGPAAVRRPRPDHAAGADRLGEAVEVDRLVGGHQAHLQLAGAPALTHDQVAQQAVLRAAVIGGQAALAAPPQRRAPRL